MLKGIEFHNSSNREYQFDMTNDNNLMSDLTNNIIILCSNWRTKNFILKQICDIYECKHEEDIETNHIYNTENEVYNEDFKTILSYRPTTVLLIDGIQQIILTVEAPFIFEAHSIEDIWFANEENNLISIYPLYVFKGHKDDWDKGEIEIYKNFINGKYGCYNGYDN